MFGATPKPPSPSTSQHLPAPPSTSEHRPAPPTDKHTNTHTNTHKHTQTHMYSIVWGVYYHLRSTCCVYTQTSFLCLSLCFCSSHGRGFPLNSLILFLLGCALRATFSSCLQVFARCCCFCSWQYWCLAANLVEGHLEQHNVRNWRKLRRLTGDIVRVVLLFCFQLSLPRSKHTARSIV